MKGENDGPPKLAKYPNASTLYKKGVKKQQYITYDKKQDAQGTKGFLWCRMSDK